MFPLVNLSGGVGDMYYFFKIISLSPDQRVEWANKSDEKVLSSIIWKKEIKTNEALDNGEIQSPEFAVNKL